MSIRTEETSTTIKQIEIPAEDKQTKRTIFT